MKRTTILAVSLVLAAGIRTAQAQEGVVATVNGEKITSAEITKKLWWQYSAQALSDLIDERLLLQDAAKLKITYDPAEAEKRFNALAAGYKDKKDFENSLKAVGWTTEDVKTLIRRQMLQKNAVIAVKGISVTDADVKTAFEQNKDKIGRPESIKARQIYVATKAEADEAYQVLGTGADFAKLSALKSADENLKKREGDIGDISKGMLLPDIEKAIFALKPGDYTKPIQTGAGYSIFKVESVKPGETAKLTDSLKSDIKATLINQAVVQKLPELVKELRQQAKIEVLK